MTGVLGLVQQHLERREQSPGVLDVLVVEGDPLLVVYLPVLVDVLLLQLAHSPVKWYESVKS